MSKIRQSMLSGSTGADYRYIQLTAPKSRNTTYPALRPAMERLSGVSCQESGRPNVMSWLRSRAPRLVLATVLETQTRLYRSQKAISSWSELAFAHNIPNASNKPKTNFLQASTQLCMSLTLGIRGSAV